MKKKKLILPIHLLYIQIRLLQNTKLKITKIKVKLNFISNLKRKMILIRQCQDNLYIWDQDQLHAPLEFQSKTLGNQLKQKIKKINSMKSVLLSLKSQSINLETK